MTTIDRRLQRLGTQNNNVVARAALLAIGVTDHMIRTHVRRKRWRMLQRGVYLLGAAPPTWEQQCLAALMAAGVESTLAAECGLAAWGVDGAERSTVQLLVPRACGPEVRGAVVHRTTVADKTRRCGLLRTSSIERLLVDFAATAPTAQLETAVESALAQRLTAERRLWAVAANAPQNLPGLRHLVRVLEARPLGKAARSQLEIELLKVIKAAGLPTPTRNHDVWVDGKRYEIDLAYPDSLGAIEADSRRYHSTATQRRRDAKRQAAIETLGYRFRRFTWADVFGRPDWVADEIRDLLADGVIARNASQPRKRAG